MRDVTVLKILRHGVATRKADETNLSEDVTYNYCLHRWSCLHCWNAGVEEESIPLSTGLERK